MEALLWLPLSFLTGTKENFLFSDWKFWADLFPCVVDVIIAELMPTVWCPVMWLGDG